jgi:isocitrate dehydrogenase
MLLQYIGWKEAADLITSAIEMTIMNGQLTPDLAQFVKNATILGTQEFANAIISNF